MKYILVMWLMHQHYMEIKYIKDFQSIEACQAAGDEMLGATKYHAHYHCGMQ